RPGRALRSSSPATRGCETIDKVPAPRSRLAWCTRRAPTTPSTPRESRHPVGNRGRGRSPTPSRRRSIRRSAPHRGSVATSSRAEAGRDRNPLSASRRPSPLARVQLRPEGSRGPGNVTQSPFGDCADWAPELAALTGELVFEARWMGAVRDASDQQLLLEAVEALGQNIGGDCFRRGQQLAEALATPEQIADEQKGPSVTDQVEGAGDRARRATRMRRTPTPVSTARFRRHRGPILPK